VVIGEAARSSDGEDRSQGLDRVCCHDRSQPREPRE